MQFFAEGGKDPFRLLPLVAATFPKGTAFGGGGKVSGRAKGPILEGAVERSETVGVLPVKAARKPIFQRTYVNKLRISKNCKIF